MRTSWSMRGTRAGAMMVNATDESCVDGTLVDAMLERASEFGKVRGVLLELHENTAPERNERRGDWFAER